MDDKAQKQLDHLIKKSLKNSTLDTPSVYFTRTVMSQIETLKASHFITYKPLISKRQWLVIGFVVLSVMTALFLTTSFESYGWLNKINFSALSLNNIVLPKFNITSTFMYAVIVFGAFFMIQISWLKKTLEKEVGV